MKYQFQTKTFTFDICETFLAKVGLLLGYGDELRPHLRPDGLNHGLDLLADVEVEAEHLVPDERPLLDVQVHGGLHSSPTDSAG